MAYISQVTLPNGSVYDLKDKNLTSVSNKVNNLEDMVANIDPDESLEYFGNTFDSQGGVNNNLLAIQAAFNDVDLVLEDIPTLIDFTNTEIDTITGLDDTDAEEYSNNIAQDVIENYIGTELCGVNQSVEDAINGLNSSIGLINTKIGNVSLPTTAQTVTGAIVEHEEDISTINDNLTPASISYPTIYQSRVSILAGGYIKIGRMVVVDIQITAALASYSGGTIFTGFPASLGTNSISAYVLDGSSQIPMGAHCTSSGNMTITSPSGITMTNKDIYIAGVYIAN